MICDICPIRCDLSESQVGACGSWKNREGHLVDLGYGRLTHALESPVENQLLHFMPGSKSLTLATTSCTMACQMCHNSKFTVEYDDNYDTKFYSPQNVILEAVKRNCSSVTFGLNEPLLHPEYVEDIVDECIIHGIKTIISTSGYANIDKSRRLLKKVDAVSYSPKAFSNAISQQITKRKDNIPLKNLRIIKDLVGHIEINYTVIPTVNDDIQDFSFLIFYLKDLLGSDVPVRLCRFRPSYKMLDKEYTKEDKLLELKTIAEDYGMQNVYIGNVGGSDHSTTYCNSCGNPVIIRDWFEILKDYTSNGKCRGCGSTILGHYTDKKYDQELIYKSKIF